jgi:hypothetical protein
MCVFLVRFDPSSLKEYKRRLLKTCLCTFWTFGTGCLPRDTQRPVYRRNPTTIQEVIKEEFGELENEVGSLTRNYGRLLGKESAEAVCALPFRV